MDREREAARAVMEQVNRVILGKKSQIREIMTAFLADGHILLEDIPGVGKTTMAMAFSRTMELEYRRIQFTPDILPSDLTGFSVYRREEEKFVYQPGSVFCNLLLADEINRTSPKTQSALLEVMEERRVTVDGSERVDRVRPVMAREMLCEVQKAVHEVYMKEELYRYLVELVTATRVHPHVERGASPRATIALVRMAKASAWLAGRNYVTPNDVGGQFPYVVSHRIMLNASAVMEGIDKKQVLTEIAGRIKKPPMGEGSA